MLHREIVGNRDYLEYLESKHWELMKKDVNLKQLIKLSIKLNKLCYDKSYYVSYSYNVNAVENYLLNNLNSDIRRCIINNMNTSKVLKKHKKMFLIITKMIRNNQRKEKEEELLEFQRKYNESIQVKNKLYFNVDAKKVLKCIILKYKNLVEFPLDFKKEDLIQSLEIYEYNNNKIRFCLLIDGLDEIFLSMKKDKFIKSFTLNKKCKIKKIYNINRRKFNKLLSN